MSSSYSQLSKFNGDKSAKVFGWCLYNCVLDAFTVLKAFDPKPFRYMDITHIILERGKKHRRETTKCWPSAQNPAQSVSQHMKTA